MFNCSIACWSAAYRRGLMDTFSQSFETRASLGLETSSPVVVETLVTDWGYLRCFMPVSSVPISMGIWCSILLYKDGLPSQSTTLIIAALTTSSFPFSNCCTTANFQKEESFFKNYYITNCNYCILFVVSSYLYDVLSNSVNMFYAKDVKLIKQIFLLFITLYQTVMRACNLIMLTIIVVRRRPCRRCDGDRAWLIPLESE